MAELWDSLAVRPELARTLARHLAAFHNGTLPRRTQELCALMVSWLNACDSCLESHAKMAVDLGVDAATLAELGNFAHSDRFSGAERAALSAAVALTREPRALPEPVLCELQRHYDWGDVVEIVAVIGLHNYLTRASNALRRTGATV